MFPPRVSARLEGRKFAHVDLKSLLLAQIPGFGGLDLQDSSYGAKQLRPFASAGVKLAGSRGASRCRRLTRDEQDSLLQRLELP